MPGRRLQPADELFRREGAPLWLNSCPVDDFQISVAIERVKFPSGPQRVRPDRMPHDLAEAGPGQFDDLGKAETATIPIGAVLNRPPQLSINRDEISGRPR